MKVCPTCQSSNYPDGFKYCPQCNSSLMSNDEYQRSMNASMIPNPTDDVTTVEAFHRVAEEPAAPKNEPAPAYVAPRHVEFTAQVSSPPKVEKPVAPPVAASVPAPPVVPKEIPPTSATTKAAGVNGFAMVPSGSDLKFTMPDSGSLLSRLISNVKNIKDVNFGAKRVAAGTTDEFQVLLEDESLIARFFREINLVIGELQEDPKKFLTEFVRGEGGNLRRRNALLAGSELAIVGYATLYICLQAALLMGKEKGTLFNAVVIGLVTYLVACYAVRGFLLNRIVSRFSSFITVPKLGLEFANWVPVIALLAFIMTSDRWFCQVFPKQCGIMEEDKLDIKMLAMLTEEKPPEVASKPKPKEAVVIKGKGGYIGGAKPKPERAQGGGGNVDPTPATKGPPPQFANNPVPLPKIRNNSSLIVPDTILGDQALNKPRPGQTGMDNGVDAPLPSKGNGGGAGVGSGSGGGLGPGQGGNTGGGSNRTGGGAGRGTGSGDEVFSATGSMKPNFLHTEKARYTEQARTNRVQGTVVVSAVFTADGRITSIRVIRGLPDGLDEEAIKALHKFRFTPATKNGQPVSTKMSMEFTFNLL